MMKTTAIIHEPIPRPMPINERRREILEAVVAATISPRLAAVSTCKGIVQIKMNLTNSFGCIKTSKPSTLRNTDKFCNTIASAAFDWCRTSKRLATVNRGNSFLKK